MSAARDHSWCWWMLASDGGCHAVPHDVAAEWLWEDPFCNLYLGEYVEAKKIALSLAIMASTGLSPAPAPPSPPPGELCVAMSAIENELFGDMP